MIQKDLDLEAKEDGAMGFDGLDNGEQFFLHCSVILLQRRELLQIESDRLVELGDGAAELKIAGVGRDVEGKLEVWVAEKDGAGKGAADFDEGLLLFGGPDKLSFCVGDASKRLHIMGAMRDELFVEVHKADEGP